MRVAYYAHHSGSGHLRNAFNFDGAANHEVRIFTSALNTGRLTNVVTLPDDSVRDYKVELGYPFHYAPTGHGNVKDRMAQLAGALYEFDPDVVVVDVSVEVTAFAKLLGYPTIVRRLHGTRRDRAHRNMYDMANGIVALYEPHLEALDVPDSDRRKTTYLGTVDLGSDVEQLPVYEHQICVLTSLGGNGIDLASLDHAARQLPDWRWVIVGKTYGETTASNVEVRGVIDSPAELLRESEVVVSSGGHNATAACVSARRPLIVFPEERPYYEQKVLAAQINRVYGVPVIDTWDQDWASLVREALLQNSVGRAGSMLTDKATLGRRIDEALAVALSD